MALSPQELGGRYASYNSRTVEALHTLDMEAINYELVADLVLFLAKQPSDQAARTLNQLAADKHVALLTPAESKKGKAAQPPPPLAKEGDGDAILVFLPGLKEITTLLEMLLDHPAFGREPQRSWVLPLHSTLPPDDQRRVFLRPPPGQNVRKVVLATNIAETAITIDDIGFVVDTGRMKETRYDPSRRMESLDEVRVSRANAKQRRGRAGRVRPGVAIHLFTRHAHECVLAGHQVPEVCRVPLDRLVLTIKALRYPQPAAEVCARLIEPPLADSVRRAISELVEIGALEMGDAAERGGACAEELTPLGEHLSKLPVDVRIGKLLLLGAIFNVADEALTVAAMLSFRSPFMAPFDKRNEADAAKASFKAGQSDHLTVLRAYRQFDQAGGNRFQMARDCFLSVRTLQSIAQLKRQLLELLSDARFVRQGLRSRAVEAVGRRERGSDGCRAALRFGVDGALDGDPADLLADARLDDDLDGSTGELVKSLLCAALYPQVVVVEAGKKGNAKLMTREEGSAELVAVQVHPSSVNAREQRFASKYLVFAEKVKTGAVFVRDCAPVSPFALLMFAGELRSEGGVRVSGKKGKRTAANLAGGREALLCIDQWIHFRVPQRIESLILDLREQLEALLKTKIARPELELSTSGRGVLDAVVSLLATPLSEIN